MPKATGLRSLEARISGIISDSAAAIAQAVRKDMADELRRVLDGKSFSPKFAQRGGSGRGGAGQKRNVPKSCLYPGCGNASKGPRWSFLCDDHKGIAVTERRKLLLDWKAKNGNPGADASSAPKAKGKATRQRGRKKVSKRAA